MLKRIKDITKTGVFRKANGLGEFEFGKLTVFYGLNTFGKTTLKDVFHSIAKDDAQILRERQSIPDDATVQQMINMSFEDGGIEKTLKFENGNWSPDVLKGKLLIFDNEFTHKNLVTGSVVTRDNKESLSDFILGEEGVKLSEEIRGMKKTLQDAKGGLVKPDYLKTVYGEQAVQDFLGMKISESEEDLQKSRAQKSKALENLADTEKIKNLSEMRIPELGVQKDAESALADVNTELKRDYKEVTTTALEKIKTHLQTHVAGDGGQSWIAQGVTRHKQGDDCPFCGQSLAEVKDLINAYGNYFNDDYKNFVADINQKLSAAENKLALVSISVFSAFQTLILILGEYQKYDPQITWDINLETLKTAEAAVKKQLDVEKKKIADVVASKKREPHRVLEDLELSDDFRNAVKNLEGEMSSISSAMDNAIKAAKKLREDHSSMTGDDTAKRKRTLEEEIADIDKKMARIKQDSQCQKYVNTLEQINKLEGEIKKKSEALEQQQSDYVQKYFEELNTVYGELGSRGFELKSVTNNRGHKKIYELKITYRGKEVPSDDVSKVLSESDKRSLSFAVFLSKLKHLENKADYIVVLDDPVVSFDDNRISTSVGIIKNLAREFKQVIVLTHYPSLIKKLLNSHCEGVYLEVIQNQETSYIQRLDGERFTLSDYELAFKKIHGYVQREHSEDISKDCRIFMEKHLQFRFHRGIRERNISLSPLKDFMVALKDNGHLDTTQHQELDDFREALNPEHHDFVFNKNEEDVRTYAGNLLNKLLGL